MRNDEDNTSNIKSPIIYRWNFYNDIPYGVLLKHSTILDVGAGYGRNQILGKNGNYFIEASCDGRYYGIDLDSPQPLLLNIKTGIDVVGDWCPVKQYDVVLAIHFIEHIDIKHWESVFEKLKASVAVGGVLVIMVPYMESPRPGHHKVFNIDELFLLRYIDTLHSWFGICHTRMTRFGRNRLFRRFISYIYHLLRGRFEWPFGYSRKSIMVVWRNV
jgi:SAM-dependent methyltransferase